MRGAVPASAAARPRAVRLRPRALHQHARRQFFKLQRCSTRVQSMRRMPAAADTEHTTPRTVTRPSPCAPPKPSSQPGRMAKPGRRIVAAPMRATRYSARHADWAERSGRIGAAFTSAALSKPRCAASNCWANESWRVTSTIKWQNCRYELPC
jgi:hypothetical protein